MNNIFKNYGFTFIELLLTVGIFSILAVSTITIYGGMQVSSQLNEANYQIIQALRLAREYSRGSFAGQRYGVYFEINDGISDSYTIYQGDSYLARSLDFDRVYNLGNAIILTTSFLNNEINFSKNVGIPNVLGAVFLSDNNGKSREINVNQYGLINTK